MRGKIIKGIGSSSKVRYIRNADIPKLGATAICLNFTRWNVIFELEC